MVRKVGSALLTLGTFLRMWAISAPPPPRPQQSLKPAKGHLALVAGYFSYREGYATFGDTEAMRVVLDWLAEMGISCDIACDPSNGLVGLDLKRLDPTPYDIFIYVCGPWKMDNNNLLERFGHCLKVGVNLSIEDVASNKFDLLYPRDTSEINNPDIVFSSDVKNAPLVGVCLVHSQYEYGNKQRHDEVDKAVNEFLNENEVANVKIDTLYVNNRTGVSDAISFENLVSRFDVVISSRLHGMVFSLKNGIPVVAIDCISGGAKVTKQANALDWPVVLNGDNITSESIRDAIKLCLTSDLKNKAITIKNNATKRLDAVKDNFIKDIQNYSAGKNS